MTLEKAYAYPAAAARLQEMGYTAVTENWLREHIKSIPHTKLAGRVTFTESQLAELVAARSHNPAEAQPLRPVTRRRSA